VFHSTPKFSKAKKGCPVAKLGGILKSHKGLINVQKAKQTNTEMGKLRVHSNDIACTWRITG
jgi:hypothetical protein